jgi:hypothetical protein
MVVITNSKGVIYHYLVLFFSSFEVSNTMPSRPGLKYLLDLLPLFLSHCASFLDLVPALKRLTESPTRDFPALFISYVESISNKKRTCPTFTPHRICSSSRVVGYCSAKRKAVTLPVSLTIWPKCQPAMVSPLASRQVVTQLQLIAKTWKVIAV